MARWNIDEPMRLSFDGVVALKIRGVAGSVSVLAAPAGEEPSLEVAEIAGEPLLVSHDAGILTITYADLTLDGLRERLRPRPRRANPHSARLTVRVPRDCPVSVTTVKATTVVTGISAKTSVKSGTGDITLDGVTGRMEVHSVSGDLMAREISGALGFTTVSGDLAVASATLDRLSVKTVTGRVTVDAALHATGRLEVGTVSGEVAIRLPESLASEVELRSASGEVGSTFPGLTATERSGGFPGGRRLAGTVGAGGPGGAKVSVSTVSADIALLQREDERVPRGELA